MDKNKVNYFLDMLLLISFIIAAVTGIFLGFSKSNTLFGMSYMMAESLHMISGVAMTVSVFLHFVSHWKWIAAMSKNMFSCKK